MGGDDGRENPQVGLVGAAGSVRALRPALVARRRGRATVIRGGAGRGQGREERERRQDGGGASARHGGVVVVEQDEPVCLTEGRTDE